MTAALAIVDQLKAAGQDFEWYPTTREMAAVIVKDLAGEDIRHTRIDSILDIGAGDGRVLGWLAEKFEHAKLYAIEKSTILQQAQPDRIVPVGTDFWEQNLMALPVDVAFSNPPYQEFVEWTERIIRDAHARVVYLIIPERWQHNIVIQDALKTRNAEAHVLAITDFYDAERQSRAKVHILKIEFAGKRSRYGYHEDAPDPFDAWFEQTIDTFDKPKAVADDELHETHLARIRTLDSIPDMVAAYDEEYARMEQNYRDIFKLDAALLKELGVSKEGVREGLKKRMVGLKATYWGVLFEKLDVVTSRLTTRTKKGFLERLVGQETMSDRRSTQPVSPAFTTGNCYAVVIWAIKAANQYFDQQVVELFRDLATHDGVHNYKSNQKTWEKDGWRYNSKDHSHFALDYRIVQQHHSAIAKADGYKWDYPGGLRTERHEQLDDIIAVLGNLGFRVQRGVPSRVRVWRANEWQDFVDSDGKVIFQAKGFLNGNMHFRFMPAAIKALNIEAGRLLGWLRSPAEAVAELGVTPDEARQYFGGNKKLGAAAVKLLPAAEA